MHFKFQFILLLFALTLCHIGLHAQGREGIRRVSNDKITISFSEIKLSEAIVAIQRVSKYTFFYDNQQIDLSQQVSLSADNLPLENALKQMFAQTNLDFEISNRQIVLFPSKSNSNTVNSSNTVTGIVTDENSLPMIGVTVTVDGSNNGTVTDNRGYFSFREISFPARLNFSYLGYKTMHRTLSGAEVNISIRMSEESVEADEIVVVGYGVQKKVNLTGAVATVNGNELLGRSSNSVAGLLQGQIPNLNITSSSGRPGMGGDFNIRGINSISSGGGPLILVDGVEGNINIMNPHDIASVTVLKDASAAAVYGARAAYGVILVTTKEGEKGKASLNYNGRFSVGNVTTSTDFETRGYYSAAINDMFFSTYQGGNYTSYTESDYYQLWIRRNDKTEHPDRPWIVEKNRQYKYYGNFDWYNYLVDNSRPTWEHNLSINGGNEQMKYWISGGYYSQEGTIKLSPDEYKRYNFHTRVTGNVNKWLKVSNNTSFQSHGYLAPGIDMYSRMTNHGLASISPVNPDGSLVFISSASASAYTVTDGASPVLTYGKSFDFSRSSRLFSTFEAVTTPCKNLSITANYTYLQYNSFDNSRAVKVPYSRYPGVIEYMNGYGGETDRYSETHGSQYFNGGNLFATYSNTFCGHNVSATAGANYETRSDRTMSAYGTDLLTEELSDFELVTGEDMDIRGGQSAYSLFGVFYRFNYDYKGKYLFEVSGRYDGSSRFGRGMRYGFFPSASAGWRISEEEFFKPARKWFDNLKLRCSYGTLGNQQVGYYDYIQVINTGAQLNYAFGDLKIPGANVSAPNSAAMTWEKVTTTNLGLDLAFLRSRLAVTADAYIRDTKGMLMPGKALPAVYGASSPRMNAADLRTSGWELSVGWRDAFSLGHSPFRYSVVAGLSDNTSKITKYDNPTKAINQPYVGMQLGQIWGYVVNGYFLTNEEAFNYPVDQHLVNSIIDVSVKDTGPHAGDLKFEDLDGNGIIERTLTADDLKDQKVIGNSLPRYAFSTKLSAEWKGIDFSIFFQGIGRQHWYPAGDALMFWGPYARPYVTFLPSDFLSNVWSESNPNAYFPRPRGYVALADTRELGSVNSRYLQDLAYCRLKNLTLGYSLPKKWLNRISMQQLRIYFSGENLLTFTKLKSRYIDPEQASAANTWNNGTSSARNYPYAKTYSFGVDITF